ncbi:MAG: recombinase family protein [Lachnospiraceae bacterium]|nr:recombinase family protein [Lachnospiraceae bacterium]
MNRVYGYARVSTMKQNIARQIDNIKRSFPDAVIITEEYTGTTIDRPAWNKLKKQLRNGDTVIFDEVSRMSRNAAEGFRLYRELYEKGVNLVFIKEPHINTDVYRSTAQAPETGEKDLDETLIKGLNEYLMRLAEKQIEIAFQTAQAEVDFLHQRTSEGVRRAQAEGKQVGRAKGSRIETKKTKSVKAIIEKHNKDFGGSLNDIDTMKLAGCARNTYYKAKRELKAM